MDYTWTGTNSNDFSDAGNYDPNGLPASGDTLNFTGAGNASTGTCNAGTIICNLGHGLLSIAGGIINGNVTNTSGFILGGVFNGTIENHDELTVDICNGIVTNSGTIHSGTYNNIVNSVNGLILGGIFNNTVTNDATSEIDTGHFYKDVINYGTLQQGYDYAYYYATVTNNNLINSGKFYGTFINNGTIQSDYNPYFECVFVATAITNLPPSEISLANLKGLQISDSILFTKEKGINGSGILGMV